MSTADRTLAGQLWPSGVLAHWQRNAILAILASLFVAVCAQINIPLQVVPVTMQSFAVLCVGAALGSRLGASALVLYAAEGAVGLPVFAEYKAGPGVLLGLTGGYILGFVIAAAAVGYLAERGFDRSVPRMLAAALLGTILIYVPGLPWLAWYTGWDKVLQFGLIPFVWVDLLKAALVALLFPAVWELLGRK